MVSSFPRMVAGWSRLVAEMPELLYIMGTARSGSTILEILLASGDSVFGGGELSCLIKDGFVHNTTCSCGDACMDCEVWGKVVEDMCLDRQELEAWAALQQRVDWHDGFFRQMFRLLPDKDLERYRTLTSRLLEAISRTTGCAMVVDSSKYAGRALALARVVGVGIKVVCLTRSPSGLMASFQKQNKDEQRPKSPTAALAYYLVTLASLRLAIWRLGRENVFMLRYETLMANPEEVLESIGCWAGIDIKPTLRRLRRQKDFDVGHLVTANRLRKRGRVRFNPSCSTIFPRGITARMVVILMNLWRLGLGF